MEQAEKEKNLKPKTAGPPPNDARRFYVNGRYLLREIAGVYVLIPKGETDAPQNSITALNETGRFLWTQFEHPCSVSEAAAAAQARYTGQPADILRDTEEFVRAGLRTGLLREVTSQNKIDGKAV